MSVLLIIHLLLTAAYAGFQWTVQVVVYRQFALVPAAVFVDYERAHQRRISLVVGPLFGGQVVTAAALLITGGGWLRFVSMGLLAMILLITALVAVPLHRRLTAGFDAGAYRSLLRVDLARALLATVNAGVAAGLLR
ncbi:MAG: DUF1772 domain-containing protein [Nakamurella sp.]